MGSWSKALSCDAMRNSDLDWPGIVPRLHGWGTEGPGNVERWGSGGTALHVTGTGWAKAKRSTSKAG